MRCLCFLNLAITVIICKIGDCGLQPYQTVTILKRAKTVEFTTITPILYIYILLQAAVPRSFSVVALNYIFRLLLSIAMNSGK